MKILILEDCGERRQKMTERLAEQFPRFEVLYSESATEYISAFKQLEHAQIIAIALDHDLEMIQQDDGSTVDPGDGRQVANFLTEQQPVCPIVIHSTNSPAAVGMETVLTEAGWKVERVFPYGDLEWIETMWFPAMRKALASNIA